MALMPWMGKRPVDGTVLLMSKPTLPMPSLQITPSPSLPLPPNHSWNTLPSFLTSSTPCHILY